jgi:hypothetical protein
METNTHPHKAQGWLPQHKNYLTFDHDQCDENYDEIEGDAETLDGLVSEAFGHIDHYQKFVELCVTSTDSKVKDAAIALKRSGDKTIGSTLLPTPNEVTKVKDEDDDEREDSDEEEPEESSNEQWVPLTEWRRKTQKEVVDWNVGWDGC